MYTGLRTKQIRGKLCINLDLANCNKKCQLWCLFNSQKMLQRQKMEDWPQRKILTYFGTTSIFWLVMLTSWVSFGSFFGNTVRLPVLHRTWNLNWSENLLKKMFNLNLGETKTIFGTEITWTFSVITSLIPEAFFMMMITLLLFMMMILMILLYMMVMMFLG